MPKVLFFPVIIVYHNLKTAVYTACLFITSNYNHISYTYYYSWQHHETFIRSPESLCTSPALTDTAYRY